MADTINGSVRLELSRSSLAPPPVSLPLFSIPTPTCGLLDRNHLTVTFRKSKMGRRTPYRSTKPLLPVLILHSYPPDTCFARGWSGRDLPVGVEVGCSAVKSRSATNPSSPACRWCKAFLGRKKNHRWTESVVGQYPRGRGRKDVTRSRASRHGSQTGLGPCKCPVRIPRCGIVAAFKSKVDSRLQIDRTNKRTIRFRQFQTSNSSREMENAFLNCTQNQTIGIEFLVAIQMAKVLLISGIPNKCNG